MNVNGLAGSLALTAALTQGVALLLALQFAHRYGFSWRRLALTGGLALMLARRALAGLGGLGLAHAGGVPLAEEGAGLVISCLVVMGLTWYGGTAKQPPAQPSPAPAASADGAGAASAREEERELLCYDLHDGLAQLVVGAQMHWEAFVGLRDEEPKEAERELTLAGLRLQEAAEEVTRIVSYLRPGASQAVPLGEAVRQYVGQLAASEGWRYECVDGLEGRRLAPFVEAMTYRVIQEALNNAAKHAATPRVSVSLRVEEGALIATVRDWGQGLAPDAPEGQRQHLGLRGMRTRAGLLGGTCTIDRPPGGGTRVAMQVPRAEER